MVQALMVRGHFDGETIRLDEPLTMETGTQVIVTVLPTQLADAERELWLRLSERSLERAYGPIEPDYTMALLKEPGFANDAWG